jgi:hypothetical protein
MSEDSKKEHDEMLALMRENSVLIKENNVLLKRIYRHSMWSLGLKVVWFMVIIGLPIAVYFYLLDPYFQILGIDTADVQNILHLLGN